MKKKLLILALIITSITSVSAMPDKFILSKKSLSIKGDKQDEIKNKFPKEYNLEYKIESKNDKLKTQITNLSKKTTYLLLGNMNGKKETSEEYYNRHQEYLDLRYIPDIPKDKNTLSGYDENSKEYKEYMLSSENVPFIFNILNEIDIKYNSFGDIIITRTDNMILSTVILPNVKLKIESTKNPMEYEEIQTNFIIYYFFKKYKKDYKLYYLEAQRTDQTIEDLENKNDDIIDKSNNNIYYSNFKDLYDFSKIENITPLEENNIYEKNKQNIITLSSYYNNKLVSSSNGILISNGLILTTWDFLKESLISGQYIIAKNKDNENYEIDGIVTISTNTNLVVIKTTNPVPSSLNISKKEINVEDPVIYLSNNDKTAHEMKKGIIYSNDGFIQSTISISKFEQGSLILDKEGNAIGITTAKSTNSNTSYGIKKYALEEIKNKFSKLDFNKIKVKTFNDLKENYYYVEYSEEIKNNNIPTYIWNRYKKIGNIEKNIPLELIKANYEKKIVSLRYKNNVSNYISSFDIINKYFNELENDKYKRVLNSDNKIIYKNKYYQITIMEEFDYLIITMVSI